MTYVKLGPFVDVPAGTTPPPGAVPLSAATLDHIEDGIFNAGTGGGTIAGLPAGSVISVVQNGDGSWPNRLSSRTDLRCMWLRIVAGSSDPAAATSPSVAGAYTNDVVIGA